MKNLIPQNLDTFSKRILSIAISLSMVCCAMALLLFSVQNVQAKTTNNPLENVNELTIENAGYPTVITGGDYIYRLVYLRENTYYINVTYEVYKDGTYIKNLKFKELRK